MSMKLIACVLAACVVAVGGVFLIHGECPFSSGTGCCTKSLDTCPTGECTMTASAPCCPDSEEACCPVTAATSTVAVTAKKPCCCCESAATSEPITAAFGGAVAVGNK